jgi:hypothetical protein
MIGRMGPSAKPFLTLALVLLTLAPALSVVTIDPPAGWKAVDSSNSPFRLEGLWTSRPVGGAPESLNVLKQVMPGTTLAQYLVFNETQLRRLDPNLNFEIDRDEPCGPSAAHRFKYQMTYGEKRVTTEQLIVEEGSTFYIGTYSRLVDQPVLPEALLALKTMCSHLTAGSPAPGSTTPAATAAPAPVPMPSASG